MTQPVLLQCFVDEFGINKNNATKLPAPPGHALAKPGDNIEPLSPQDQTYCRSGVGILMHVMRWSCPDVLNRVRELSRYVKEAVEDHANALTQAMSCCTQTVNRGCTVAPKSQWSCADKECVFTVGGKSNSNFSLSTSPRTRFSDFM